MCDDLLAHHHRLAATSFIPLSSSPTWFSTQSNFRELNRTFLFLSPAYHLPPLPATTSTSTTTTTTTAPQDASTTAPNNAQSISTIPFTHFPAFFDINPLYTVYAFDNSILTLFPHSDHSEMLYELVRHPAADDQIQFTRQETQVLSNYELVEDTEWFTRTHPARKGVMKYEKCLSVIDKHAPFVTPRGGGSSSGATGEAAVPGEPKRAAYILLLPASSVPGSDGGDKRLYVPELQVMPEYHGRGTQHFSVGKALAKMLLSAVVDVASDVGGAEVWTNVGLERDMEMVEVWLGMGWVVNRPMWVVERNQSDEGKVGGAGGSAGGGSGSGGSGSGSGGERRGGEGGQHHGWKFGEWGKGMKGWRERWVKALDEISHGHHNTGGSGAKH